MSSELENQIQSMFRTIYEAVDLKYLRPFKRQMFKCGHECLDDKNSPKQAEQCIDDCGKVMHKAMAIVQKEVNSFQGRIDRCLIDCQDGVRHEKNESEARRTFDQCAERCVKKFAPTVAEVSKVISEELDKLKKSEGVS